MGLVVYVYVVPCGLWCVCAAAGRESCPRPAPHVGAALASPFSHHLVCDARRWSDRGFCASIAAESDRASPSHPVPIAAAAAGDQPLEKLSCVMCAPIVTHEPLVCICAPTGIEQHP